MGNHLRVVPLTLKEANGLVQSLHRHHKPAQGHRFSLGCCDEEGTLHGAAIVGRPVARMCPPRRTAEVTRLVTNGVKNGCSILYAASARTAREMGFEKIQTYILDTESGTSLLAAGWIDEGIAGGGQWKHTDGRVRRTDQPNGLKRRYAKYLNEEQPEICLPS